MQQFDKFVAIVRLRRGDGYVVRPEAESWDGREVEAEALWEIEDRPEYAGEWACRVEGFPFGWIASGDLCPNS